MIYFLIALIASIFGAISGLGGGIIIKPMLDMFSDNSVQTINILSSFTVFAMAAAALVKQIISKTKIDLKLSITLAIGAIMGGYLGNLTFKLLVNAVAFSKMVVLIQNLILVMVLLGVLIYMNKKCSKKSYLIKNPIAVVLTGIGLGTISAFLGIGGGPINILALVLLFSMEPKQATVNSILLIFFSQLSKLATVGFSGGFVGLNVSALWLMIPAGIIGGLVGAKLNKKMPQNKIMIVFNIVLLFVILISATNIVSAIFSLTSGTLQ